LKFDKYIYDSQFLGLIDPNLLDSSFDKETFNYKKYIALDSVDYYVKYENWDSNFFGRNISRIVWIRDAIGSNEMFIEFINNLMDYDCYFIRLNQNHSFCKYADICNLSTKLINCSNKISLIFNFDYIKKKNINYINNNIITIDGSLFHDEVREQIINISRSAFIHNRFLRDPNFEKRDINILYESWLVSSIGTKNYKLYSIMEKDILSFLLYNENINPIENNEKIGFISLIATKQGVKNKNLATNLLEYCFKIAKENNTKYIIANTDSMNIPAVNLFISNGFKVQSILKEYHYWNAK